MEEEKKLEKRKNIEIFFLSIIIVALLGALIYLLFIKKDTHAESSKPQDNQQVENNNQELQKSLEKINEEASKLLHTETSIEEFEKQAKKYFSNEMINELIKYYDKDTKTICIETSACNVSGGYFGETTDIWYRKFEIISVQGDILTANGIYGEALDNITGKTEIIYQKDNAVWKIKKFDIIDLRNNETISSSLIKGTPSGYNKNTNKQVITPIKQLKYDEKEKENIKIDDNLMIVFYKEKADFNEEGYYPSFDLVYKGKTLVTDKKEKHYELSFSTSKAPFEVYKLRNNYLIKAYSTTGQNEWDWLFYIHEDGKLERFERDDGALSPGSLSKIEYITINNKSYYLLTIIGFSESDGPEDYDYTESYYLNAN